MIDAHFEILKFLSIQTEPIHPDNFPNSTQSQFTGGFDKGSFNSEILVVLRHDKKWVTMVPGSNNVLINENGIMALEKERKLKEELKEQTITLQAKQWYETENAKAQYEDYHITKQNAIDGVKYAKTAIVVSIAAILIQVIIIALQYYNILPS